MEKGLSLIREQFQLENRDIGTYSPLTLAYLGDAVYEIVIRTVLVSSSMAPVNVLHRKASSLVKASRQSCIAGRIEDKLTHEERTIYKRGRNAKAHTSAKNQSIQDYRRATGFEALIGYLYLTEQEERMIELIREGTEL